MPITEELKNVKKFESVGFTHEQAEALAETIEQAQVKGQEGLKEFIRNELEKQNKDIDSKFLAFDSKLNALEARLMASQKDLLIKIFGIIVGTVGIAVTILKLFP
ncbi:MAG: hypothetical protein SCARUB_04649 [Candidatus Scalindua rubra]|uniref:DUF1640 domain-containing protein n=1 Tax=Candidatus Scalindua rubra TaxID=1872076 RepID=A0A1E3X3P5_9BACT|nr:MAG: hypothetical protein SCARUB_04649 [Candidatus Scalindua rubra]